MACVITVLILTMACVIKLKFGYADLKRLLTLTMAYVITVLIFTMAYDIKLKLMYDNRKRLPKFIITCVI